MENEKENIQELTQKQKVFVERYCIHFNGSRACREAGYSEDSAKEIASENLTKPNIKQAINKRLSELSMSAEEATKRLSDMARGTIGHFLNVDEDGQVAIQLSTDDAREHYGLIKKIKQSRREIADAGIVDITTEIELHDSKDAILNLLKMQGKFNFKQEIDHTSGGDKISVNIGLAYEPNNKTD